MDTPQLTLYFAPGASSMATHIALHEIGCPFDARPLSMAKQETRAPAFLALNAEGLVPTLVIEGRPLTEVAGTLFFLARRFPEAQLLPQDDLEGEAHVISWMSFIAATVHASLARRDMNNILAVLGLADRRLGPRAWAAGGAYSIADIHLFRLYWRVRNSFDLAAASFPNLSAHYDRMMARGAVQRTCAIEAALGYELNGLKLSAKAQPSASP